jgi:hypothetical protein
VRKRLSPPPAARNLPHAGRIRGSWAGSGFFEVAPPGRWPGALAPRAAAAGNNLHRQCADAQTSPTRAAANGRPDVASSLSSWSRHLASTTPNGVRGSPTKKCGRGKCRESSAGVVWDISYDWTPPPVSLVDGDRELDRAHVCVRHPLHDPITANASIGSWLTRPMQRTYRKIRGKPCFGLRSGLVDGEEEAGWRGGGAAAHG